MVCFNGSGALHQSVPAGQVRWEKIQDYGRTLSAMTVMPVTAGSIAPPKDSPCLEYGMYLLSSGETAVLASVAPH